AIGPFGMIRPFEMMDLRGVRQLFVTGPDPDEAVALHHRECARARKTLYALAGHGDGFAVAAHPQTVGAAHQAAVVAHLAQREPGAAVRTEIFKRRDLAVRAAEKDDLLTANLPPQRFVGDFGRRTGDVPGIFGKHVSL